MSNNQEYQNIEEYFWGKINAIIYNYRINSNDTYKFKSKDFIYYSSFYQIISNKTKEAFTLEQINLLKNIINEINNKIKEVYNNKVKIEISYELMADSKNIEIKCSIETNEENLHDCLVKMFMSALCGTLCKYVRDNNSGEIIMFEDMRIKIFFKCMSLLNNLIEKSILPPKIAIKLDPVLRYSLFLKDSVKISNDLVLEDIDINHCKKMKLESKLEPEEKNHGMDM